MNDRARAIEILEKARDILARRISERIVEMQEEILDDASGIGYSSEIETLHDQLGIRLGQLNSLIGNLPAPVEPNSQVPIVEVTTSHAPLIENSALNNTIVSAEPPQLSVQRNQLESMTLTHRIEGILDAVVAEDSAAGEKTLAILLGLSADRAHECMEFFHARYAQDGSLVERLRTLHADLAAGSVNNALMTLATCFALQGLEAILAMQSLTTRVSG